MSNEPDDELADPDSRSWAEPRCGPALPDVPQRYQDWIAQNVQDDGYGACASVTQKMIQAFPELRRVRGGYLDAIWGERLHWWCETAEGLIIDPTRAQFPTKGAFEYSEFIGKDEELSTGVCMDCGDPVYGGATFCSEECEAATRAYLNTGHL